VRSLIGYDRAPVHLADSSWPVQITQIWCFDPAAAIDDGTERRLRHRVTAASAPEETGQPVAALARSAPDANSIRRRRGRR
jgi:hypothetical protein